MTRSRRAAAAALLGCAAILAAAGCSASSGPSSPASPRVTRTVTTTVPPTHQPTTRVTTHVPVPVTSTPSGPSTGPTQPGTPFPDSTVPPSTSPPPGQGHGPVRISDYSVVGNDLWVLGERSCATGHCTVLERSSDNGVSWTALTVPSRFRGDGQVRFATAQVGYLFDSVRPRFALYMTTDGGRTWQRQPDRTDALETLDGTAIRVTHAGECPPGCTFGVEVAPIGTDQWHHVSLSGPQSGGDGAALVRTGSLSAIEIYGNPAGGAQSATSVLYTSTDGGQSWSRHAEPCPQQPHTEYDSSYLASAPDGSLAVLCTDRAHDEPQFVAVSTDGGQTFHVVGRSALGAAPITSFAIASSRTVFVSSDDTYRSDNGGASFERLGANAGSTPGRVFDLGFATTTTGHAVSVDHRYLWTTTDAGHTWTRQTVT